MMRTRKSRVERTNDENDDRQCSTIMNDDISRMGEGLQITKKFFKITFFHLRSISETWAFEFLIIVTPE